MEEILLTLILLTIWARWYIESAAFRLHKKRWSAERLRKKLDRDKRREMKAK